jgi:hypothetical protein
VRPVHAVAVGAIVTKEATWHGQPSARFPTLPGGPPRSWWIALRWRRNDPVRPLHRQYAKRARQSERITIRGDAILITNGRRITHATDYYDMTELYRQLASVP